MMDHVEQLLSDNVANICDSNVDAPTAWRKALSSALVLQTVECFSISSTRKVLLKMIVGWSSQCFAKMSSKQSSPSSTRDAALLMFAVLQGRAQPSNVDQRILFTNSEQDFHQQCVRWVSDYFFEVSHTAPEDTSVSSCVVHSDVGGEDGFFEGSVAGYKLVICLSALWALHRQCGPNFSPTSVAQRRCEKVFGERLLSKYVRMLVAFLKQEPVLPSRNEQHRSSDAVTQLRMDVHQLFGVTSALASALLAELLSSGHGREHAASVEDELVRRRAISEGPVAIRRGLRCLEEWSSSRSSCRLSTRMSTASPQCSSLVEAAYSASSLLLVYVPLLIDIVSVVVPQDDIGAFNEMIRLVEEVRNRLREDILQLPRRVAEVVHWTTAMLVHTQLEGSHRNGEVDSWLQEVSDRTMREAKGSRGRPSGVDLTADTTQDDLRPPRGTTQHHDRSDVSAALQQWDLHSVAETLQRLAQECSGAADETSLIRSELERKRHKCAQQAETISSQEAEISSLRDSLAQVRLELMEESSSHATQVSQLTSNLRSLQETSAAQSTRIKLLERQIKRYEQMSAVIRSMTSEVPASHDELS